MRGKPDLDAIALCILRRNPTVGTSQKKAYCVYGVSMEKITEITLAWELFGQGVPKAHIAKHLGRNRETIILWLQGKPSSSGCKALKSRG